MVATSLVALFLLPAIDVVFASSATSGHSQAALANDALAEILIRGAPILGRCMLYMSILFTLVTCRYRL